MPSYGTDFFNLVFQDQPNVFIGIQIERITGPLFIAKEVDVVVLQNVLSLKLFQAVRDVNGGNTEY